VQRIETIAAGAIDRTAPRARAVSKGIVLPLLGLPDTPPSGEKLRALRLGDGAAALLYAARSVEDVVTLTDPLVPVPEDPLIEAMTLVEGQPVALVDAHALFARYGEVPRAAPAARPRCVLPESEWARTILAPLVTAAGCDIVPAASAAGDPDTVTILLEDVFEAAELLGRVPARPVIRLRDHPENGGRSDTIFRYDREGLLAALAGERNLRSAAGGDSA
jgi:two-component system chemotaxis sensor kinase CheA